MRKISRSLISCLFIAVLCFVPFFSGCEALGNFIDQLKSGYSVYFTDSAITLEKGEQRTFSYKDLKFEDIDGRFEPSDIDFSLSSSDSIIVGSAGKTITARSVGSTKVTLTTNEGYKAYLTVTVAANAHSAELVFPLGRILPLSSEYSVDAYLVLDGGKRSASDYKVNWSVDGKEVSFAGNPLTLYKNGAGIHEIKAYVFSDGKKISASAYAGYYSGEIATPVVKVNKKVINLGETATFSLEKAYDYAEWYIGDVLVAEGGAPEFTPSEAGIYEVYAVVAGKVSAPVTLVVKGEAKAENVRTSYDISYPNLTVEWDGTAGASYKVEAKCDDTTVYTLTTDKTSVVIPVNVAKKLSISVKAREDQYFTAPAEASVTEADALNEVEKYYLNKKYCYGNYYISDEAEFFDFFDYMMYFRKQPIGVKSTKWTERVYMAYDYGDYDDLLGRAFEFSGITGSYNIGGTADGNTVTITIEFYTVDTPSVRSSYNQKYHYDALDALPVNFRTGTLIDYFASADKGNITVSTTDQMYRVSERGYKPVPESGTSAERVYAYAEKVLDSIVCSEMTDDQIARAIYEYIMNKNTYDGSVTGLDIESSVKSASFYMESVLIESNENSGNTYGVCDGMSKTFAFLCNMANVKAVRVTGYAGVGSDKGGHAWNKVLLDGNWYVVDCTWGDAGIKINKRSGFSYTSVRLESASHTYFLLTDEDIAQTHVEDSLLYTATSAIPYDYYATQKAAYLIFSTPLYLQTTGSELVSDLKTIANYLATKKSDNKSAYGLNMNPTYRGIEFSVCPRSLAEVKQILSDKKTSNEFYRILTRAGLSYNAFADGDTFYVVVADEDVLYNRVIGGDDDPIRRFWWWI